MVAALTLEHVMYSRVWVCEERCVEFLRKFASFDILVVDAVRQAVPQVSFRRLLSLLDEARSLSNPTLRNELNIPRRYQYPGVSFVPVVRSSFCRCLDRLFGADRLFTRRWIWLFRTRCYGVRPRGKWRSRVRKSQDLGGRCAMSWRGWRGE